MLRKCRDCERKFSREPRSKATLCLVCRDRIAHERGLQVGALVRKKWKKIMKERKKKKSEGQ